MSGWYWPVAAAYAAFGSLLWLFEARRIRGGLPDSITIFVVLASLQTCLAGIGIFATLPFVVPGEATGTAAFDRIFFATDLRSAWLVLCLTMWFFVFFYFGCAIGRLVLRPILGADNGTGGGWEFVVRVSIPRLLSAVTLGTVASVTLFILLGGSTVDRYANLILLRSHAAPVEATNLSASAFALTQTWSWLSIFALLVVRAQRGRGPMWLWCIAAAVFLALLGVSRRALFLPFLLAYLARVMWDGRWRVRWIVAGTVPLGVLLAYGKSLFHALAFSGSIAEVSGIQESWANALLRVWSDLGITIVESLGTLALLDIPPRFGVDHLLSIARRVPDRMFGLDIDFPERMVRISTRAFSNSAALDIPPGLMGQMWLDAGPFGPVIWGIVFGVQVGVLQACFQRTRRSIQSCIVFALLLFVVALPVNTGSFDFSISVDIAVLLLVVWWSVTLRREPNSLRVKGGVGGQ